MIINNVDKQEIKTICENLSSKLLTDPLMMLYCPEKAVRRDFINAYLNYFINIWANNEILLTNEDNNILISIVNPDEYSYKFKGKGAGHMKEYKLSPNIFDHQSEIEGLVEVVVPESKNARVMTVYCNIGTDFEEVQKLIDEAMEIARKQNFVLVYDTFSFRLLPLMQNKGFKLAYQKNFLTTSFIHSAMVYNL